MTELDTWRVPLDEESQESWREAYGFTAIYLNDIAAGALIEVKEEKAAERAAMGLRHLLQTLWREDLVRPVIGVFWGKPEASLVELRRMTWDDEKHRGDFALREAANETEAQKLLNTLMGDTIPALDASVAGSRITDKHIREVFEREAQPTSGAEKRLLDTLLKEMENERPDLVSVLRGWIGSEEGAS